MTTEAEIGVMWPQAKGLLGHQKPEEAGRSRPYTFQREHGPATPCIWTFGLQTERTDFCCFQTQSVVTCAEATGH